ncbi:hypothetical protein B0A48_12697 [Cryoendolithus antarcticus]|uniref:Uncharacterized protein n=1 Tax=Cryoendolithus antarcticus TaxID=1507870 RepID=A0A1V8SRF6_9PEZI|nr:hypothetical protein B0A48_12697 [Cryoendolithus antarcticus]
MQEVKATDRLWRTTAKFDKPNARRMDMRPPPHSSSPCVRGLLAPTYCISCRRIRLRAPRHCAEPSFCFTCVANNTKECYCSPLDYQGPSTPPPTSEPDGNFRLFDLPRELREEIYAYALDQRRAIRYQVLARPWYQPPLTLASRQLREEALPIFYQVNEFKFDAWESGRTAARWLSAMGDHNGQIPPDTRLDTRRRGLLLTLETVSTNPRMVPHRIAIQAMPPPFDRDAPAHKYATVPGSSYQGHLSRKRQRSNNKRKFAWTTHAYFQDTTFEQHLRDFEHLPFFLPPRTKTLFDLLAKIRLQIYELALSGPCINYASAWQPSLTLTCRQLRRESLPIFYSCSRFRIERPPKGPRLCNEYCTEKAQRWICAIGDENVSLMTSVTVHFIFGLEHRAERLEVDFVIDVGSNGQAACVAYIDKEALCANDYIDNEQHRGLGWLPWQVRRLLYLAVEVVDAQTWRYEVFDEFLEFVTRAREVEADEWCLVNSAFAGTTPSLPIRAMSTQQITKQTLHRRDQPQPNIQPPGTSFFDLPPELRNEIYKILVLDRTDPDDDWKTPPLAFTSRQLRHEVLPIYYANTHI